MNRANLWASVAAFVILLLVLNSALFVVNQAQQALVLRFGAVRQVIKDPGLYVKAPFIDDIVRYDARLLDVDPPAEEVILSDQKRIVVDTYTRFVIQEPERFYQAVRNEDGARARLREIINSAARRVLGNVDLPSVLSPKREDVMHQIQTQVAAESRQLGIAVVDVRIRRADLPPETSQAIYRRMQSERQREAAQARAEGQQRAQEIRAGADRDRTIILADAQLQAQILRGEGDAQASRLYSDAYSQDPAFFAFYRSLDAYRQALGGDTSYVLSPQSDFFKYFAAEPGRH
jgi:membrane protease subunit HflC